MSRAWKAVATISVVSVGVTVLYFTVPKEDTFDEQLQNFFDSTLYPMLDTHMNSLKAKNANKSNKVTNWFTNKVQNIGSAVEKGLLFAILFPEEAQFENYGLLRTARIKLHIDDDRHPNGIELVFIGIAGKWVLNPLQTISLSLEDLGHILRMKHRDL